MLRKEHMFKEIEQCLGQITLASNCNCFCEASKVSTKRDKVGLLSSCLSDLALAVESTLSKKRLAEPFEKEKKKPAEPISAEGLTVAFGN